MSSQEDRGIRGLFIRKSEYDPRRELYVYKDEFGFSWIREGYFGFGDFSKEKDNLVDLPTPEEYLEIGGEQYPWREYWLKYGTSFPSPSKKECLKIKKGGGLLEGNCYINALRMALKSWGKIALPQKPREILYAEGMAVHPTGAHLHAWLIIDGKVYDPTWPDAYRAKYFGVTFHPSQVEAFADKTNWVSFLQNWEIAKPYLDSILENATIPESYQDVDDSWDSPRNIVKTAQGLKSVAEDTK